MRVEEFSEKHFKILVNEFFIKKTDFYNKQELESFIKTVILSLKQRYNIKLKGIYNVNIIVDEIKCALVEIEKVDTCLLEKQDIDLRIKIIFNCDFYFRTDNYDIIAGSNDIYFLNDYFYIKAKNVENMTRCIEFGELIYDDNFNIEEVGIKVINKNVFN